MITTYINRHVATNTLHNISVSIPQQKTEQKRPLIICSDSLFLADLPWWWNSNADPFKPYSCNSSSIQHSNPVQTHCLTDRRKPSTHHQVGSIEAELSKEKDKRRRSLAMKGGLIRITNKKRGEKLSEITEQKRTASNSSEYVPKKKKVVKMKEIKKGKTQTCLACALEVLGLFL